MSKASVQDQTPETKLPESTSVVTLGSWGLYDWGNSAFWTVVQTFVVATYFTEQVATETIQGTLLWGITVSAAGFVVAIAGPILGAIADQGGRRKPWIGAFTILSVVATALIWFIHPSAEFVVPALVLVGLGTLGAEMAFIFYNAMLPRLAPEGQLGRWSGWSWSMGYAGGIGCLVLVLVALIWPEGAWLGLDANQAEHVRAAPVVAAGWFLLFALPLFLIVPDTPATGKKAGQAIRDGWRQLIETFQQLRRYSQLLRFLISELIYRNGLVTLFTFGGIYAAGTFGMDTQQILMFGIALNVAAGIGAVAFAWMDDWIGGKYTLMIGLVGVAIPGAIILLVETQLMLWIFALILGLFVGPLHAASRSFLARLTPPPLQGQMFGLHSFAGKATAFLAPAMVGLVTFLSGSQRLGMSTILIFLVAGFIVLWTVPRDQDLRSQH